LYEELNSLNGIAKVKHNLATVYEDKGEDEQAIQLYCEALAIGEQVSNKKLIAIACLNLGQLYSKKQGIKGDERGN
jgi:tetratricopeptide (TPR) repeat protein